MLRVDSLTILKKTCQFWKGFHGPFFRYEAVIWTPELLGEPTELWFLPRNSTEVEDQLINYCLFVLFPGLKGENNETRKYPAPCQALYPKCFGSTWIVVLIELEFNRRHWKLQVRSPLGSCSMRLLGVWVLHQELKIIGDVLFFNKKTDLNVKFHHKGCSHL